MLSSMVKDNIDILMVWETKLDSSFLQAQFRIEGYAPPFRIRKWKYTTISLLWVISILKRLNLLWRTFVETLWTTSFSCDFL